MVNIQSLRPARAAIFMLLVGIGLSGSSALAQGGTPRRGPRTSIHTDVLPLFQIAKMINFKITELPKSKYIFSRAELAQLSVGFANIKKPQHIVYITYGRKGGGLVRMYETNPIPGVAPSKLIEFIEAAHIYHDNYSDPTFASEGFLKGGTAIVVDSVDKDLLKEALAIVK